MSVKTSRRNIEWQGKGLRERDGVQVNIGPHGNDVLVGGGCGKKDSII